jgi:hypothetical protein
MGDQKHLDILNKGVEAWNKWREKNPEVRPDLSGAVLSKAIFYGAKLSEAKFIGAELSGANLSGADLYGATLYGADLSDADLSGAVLSRADLSGANLSGADLSGAILREATLVDADVSDAIFTGCQVHGISVWNLQGEPKGQNNLLITRDFDPYNEPTITVDNLEVAQFIYLLLHHQKLRDVINAITSKAVLILGRFGERKKYLEAIADQLRRYRKSAPDRSEATKQEYLPIIFDFEKPESRTFTETVRILAHLSRFVVVDITNPRSVPQELQTLEHTHVPLQLILEEEKPAGLASVHALSEEDYTTWPWVMVNDVATFPGGIKEVYCYTDLDDLRTNVVRRIIDSAERKLPELLEMKAVRLKKVWSGNIGELGS